MLKNAVRLCDAKFGNIYHWDGDALHWSQPRIAPAFAEARRRTSCRPGEDPNRTHDCKQKVVDIADLRAEKPTLILIRGSSQVSNLAAYGRF